MTIQTLYPDIQPSLNLSFALTKKLDPRVTFSRASSARYYDGKTVAKAEENLLLQSQAFDNAGVWSGTNVFFTANTALTNAPDGTATADIMTENVVNSSHNVLGNNVAYITGQSYTSSVFVKANGRTKVGLFFPGGAFPASDRSAEFDLTAVTATPAGTATATITAFNNGWYRITLTQTTISTTSAYGTNIGLRDASGNSSYAGDGTSGVFLWGAQLEQRSTATAYQVTTTQPITNYIPVLQTALAGVPRFDHNPTTFESLGFLVEEQRSNLLTYSEDFANAAWTKFATSITANTVVSPNGTLTGDKAIPNTTSTGHAITAEAGIAVSGTVYTLSVYAKAAEYGFMRLSFGNAAGGGFTFFNLNVGTIGTTSGMLSNQIQSVGNGWYRCTVSRAASASALLNGDIYIVSADNQFAWAGNGYSGIYIWGAQLEAGAFPTSYIPTVASQVTRSSDAASMTGANFTSWYRADEGTVYCEAVANSPALSQTYWNIDDGSSNNSILYRISPSSATFDRFSVTNGSVAQVNLGSGGFTASTSNKLAGAYKFNDFERCRNTLSATDTSGTVPVVNQMTIGSERTSFQLNGTIRKLAYYPKRLTNAQLQAITA